MTENWHLVLPAVFVLAGVAFLLETLLVRSKRREQERQNQEWERTLANIRETLDSQERQQITDDVVLRNESRKAMLDQVCKVTADLLHSAAAVITIVEHAGQRWLAYYGADWCSDETRLGLLQPLETSYCQYVVATERPLLVSDALKDLRLVNNDDETKRQIRAYLGVPVYSHEGAVVGSLCVFHNEPRRWSKKDLTIVQSYAQAIVL